MLWSALAVFVLQKRILLSMPNKKMNHSDIASEAKQTYLPYIESTHPERNLISTSYRDSSKLHVADDPKRPQHKLLIAIIKGDPVDVALDWHDANLRDCTAGKAIPVVSMANETRPGGFWETGKTQEENLCRRSNLVRVLTKADTDAHYPIPRTGGIYSPCVGMCFQPIYLDEAFH